MTASSSGRRLLAALVAALTLIGTVGVASADAYPGMAGCFIAHPRVHRGDTDRAKCIHGPRSHDGVAYVVQREVHRVGRLGHKHRKVVYVVYDLAHFQTNKFGIARFRLRIPTGLHFGVHWVHFKTGNKSSRGWIKVVRG